jgi:hypothetical protein
MAIRFTIFTCAENNKQGFLKYNDVDAESKTAILPKVTHS